MCAGAAPGSRPAQLITEREAVAIPSTRGVSPSGAHIAACH
jgi:hypothetical protein